jgi:phage N-6-adenine-methyltransferase
VRPSGTAIVRRDLPDAGIVFRRAALALDRAQTLADVVRVRDQMEAIRVLCARVKSGLAMQNQAAEIKLRAERKAGTLLAQIERAKAGRRKNNSSDARTHLQQALQEVGIARDTAFRWQKVAAISKSEFEGYIVQANEAEHEITTAGLLTKKPAVLSSANNLWFTPAPYVEAARRVLGAIDLDPASCAEANATVKAARYFTEQDDGLRHDWPGRVWLNPPYGGQAGAFVARLIDQHAKAITTAAIVLLNANSVSSQWFHPLWDRLLMFTHRRIQFTSPANPDASASTHGDVFVYFGPDEPLFITTFADFGPVLRRVG